MSVIKTNSGRLISYSLFCEEDVHISDIAAGISKINRYCGATHTPYNVAQHSYLLSYYAPAVHFADGANNACLENVLGLSRAALIHDAHEYLTNDLPTPLKRHLKERFGFDWNKLIEDPLQEVIFDKFGVDIEWLEVVSRYDRAICVSEMKQLFYDKEVSPSLRNLVGCPEIPIEPWGHEFAEKAFLTRFNGLFTTQRKYHHA